MIFERPLIDVLIKYLTQHVSATTRELFAYLKNTYPVSRAQFYRIIDELITRQILVKEKKYLTLNTIWMVEYLSLGEQMKQLVTITPVLQNLTDGMSQQFIGSSLIDIDSLAGDLHHRVLSVTGAKQIYHYQSHPYHILAFPDTERQFWSSLTLVGVKNYLMYGNDSFLDMYGAEFARLYGHASVITKKQQSFFPAQGYMVAVIGDWIIDCHFPKALTDGLAFFFDDVENMEHFHHDLYLSLFYQKHRIVFTVSNDSSRAQLLSTEIKKMM